MSVKGFRAYINVVIVTVLPQCPFKFIYQCNGSRVFLRKVVMSLNQCVKIEFPLQVHALVVFRKIYNRSGEHASCPIGEERISVFFLHVVDVLQYLQHTVLDHFILHFL